MEVLGAEFCDLTPQELAAPVNTVAVSLLEEKQSKFHSTSSQRLTWWPQLRDMTKLHRHC